jgi:hypothetical protein
MEVLDVNKWPSEPGIRFGEKEIKRLCAQFRLNSDTAVKGMRSCIELYEEDRKKGTKRLPKISSIPDLKPLITSVNTLPVSTAECERNFSAMNLICTSERNSLLITTISSIMMISINGPPVASWKPGKYLLSWLSKHRSAEDTRSRQLAKKRKLICVNNCGSCCDGSVVID